MADKIELPRFGMPSYPELADMLKDEDLTRLQRFFLTQDVEALRHFRQLIIRPVARVSHKPLLRKQLALINRVIRHKNTRRSATTK